MFRFRWINFYSLFYHRLSHDFIFYSFHSTLRTVSLVVDGGIPAFTITLFTKKFAISFCKCLVFYKIFLFCRTDSFGSLPWLLFRNHKSPIFYSILLVRKFLNCCMIKTYGHGILSLSFFCSRAVFVLPLCV